MEGSFLTQVMLPLALAIIMFGMGLTLTRDDFARLWEQPRPVLVGLSGQLLMMPLIAFALTWAFDLTPPLAIGLLILAACPGGTMSNIICHLGRANLALSVTLTAITTLVCVFWTPFLIKLAISHFAPQNVEDFSLTNTTLGLIFITLLPVLIGIFLREKYPNAAMRRESFFRRFSLGFMIAMIIAIVIQERHLLQDFFAQMLGASIALNFATIIVGALLGLIFALDKRDTVTLGIEVGIQNASMAILIAVSFLQIPAYATSASVYGLTMYLGAIVLIAVARKLPN